MFRDHYHTLGQNDRDDNVNQGLREASAGTCRVVASWTRRQAAEKRRTYNPRINIEQDEQANEHTGS